MINLPQYTNSISEPKTKTSDRLLNTNLRENVELHSSVIAMTEVYLKNLQWLNGREKNNCKLIKHGHSMCC
jgi:hypothetical protein